MKKNFLIFFAITVVLAKRLNYRGKRTASNTEVLGDLTPEEKYLQNFDLGSGSNRVPLNWTRPGGYGSGMPPRLQEYLYAVLEAKLSRARLNQARD